MSKSLFSFFAASLLSVSTLFWGGQLLHASTVYQVTALPPELEDVKSVFTKYISVFGLYILATSTVSDTKVFILQMS